MALPTVEIKQGKLIGRKLTDYEGKRYFSFQGIPYAKPPIGDLRFKAPESPEPWSGIRQATSCGAKSIQQGPENQKEGSEDCLFLNVYTPRLPCCTKCRLPVMVFIHGGTFLVGTGNDDLCGPDYLLSEMIVLVTFNYRLGLLGFLSFKDQSLGVGGNAAFKDCVQCLKWVKENITHFNGDAKNVTIFGNSSGALAVHCLVLSPKANGLFHKAIMQSGSAFCPWAVSKNNIGFEAAKAIGYEGSANNEADILKFLNNATEDQILQAQLGITDNLMPSDIRAFGPVVEYPSSTAFLTESPLYLIASDSYNKVPIIIGYTDREGMMLQRFFKDRGEQIEFPLDFQNLIPSYYNIKRDSPLSLKVAEMMKNYYCGQCEPCDQNMDNVFLLETDIMFWRGIYLTIKSHANTIPMYLYRFCADGELNYGKFETGVKLPGASHRDEFHYLFKQSYTPEIEPQGDTQKVIEIMVKLWTSFARYGDPTPDEYSHLLPVKWVPVVSSCIKCLNINFDLKFVNNPDLNRMEIWDKISEYIAQNHSKNENAAQTPSNDENMSQTLSNKDR